MHWPVYKETLTPPGVGDKQMMNEKNEQLINKKNQESAEASVMASNFTRTCPIVVHGDVNIDWQLPKTNTPACLKLHLG